MSSEDKPLSPQRPKHRTTRSITETSIPKLHRPHVHRHHPHIHRHHRDKESISAQNAHREGVKSVGGTPEEHSRAPSFVDGEAGILRKRREVGDGEVIAEREQRVRRATELRNSVMNLNTVSLNTTRRLDNTYYSVLEKLSALQSTIVSLKELANMTRSLNTDFTNESREIVEEVEANVQAFEKFEPQQKRIEELAARVGKGREKIKALGERVEAVKVRVDGWEKEDLAWRQKTRKRLRITWICASTLTTLVLGIVVFRYGFGTEPPIGLEALEALEAANITETGPLPDFEAMAEESWRMQRHTEEVLRKMAERDRDEVIEEDPRLRIFDEL